MNKSSEISVLHVDDEPDVADVSAELLKRADERISVQTATSADAGLKHLTESEIDCIVSDYQMPGMDGMEFLETVREEHPNLPFIMYTGRGSEEVSSRAIRSGVTDYLQKETGTDDFTLLANRIVNGVESHQHEQRLNFLETLEHELTELSIEFLRTENGDIDALIEEGLETLGSLVEADRSYVFEIDHKAETLSNTHEWCAEGVEPQIDGLQDLPPDTFPWWMQKLESFENLTIPNVSDLPPEAETEQEILQEQDITSLIVTPMISNGELVGFIGFDWVNEQEAWSDGFIDILRMASELITTARRRKVRRQELERHEAYLEYSRDIIAEVDENGTILYQNPAVEDHLDFEVGEMRGDRFFEYVHPKDSERVKTAFEEFVNQGAASMKRIEFRMQNADGSYQWFESIGLDQTNTVVGSYVVYSRGVTERKEREQEIQQLKDRLELAVEGAKLGVWDWDMTTDYVDFNEQWAQMLGYSLDEIEPDLDAWEKRLHPEDVDDVEAALDAHIAGETDIYDFEHRLRTADGDWKWIRDVGKVFERDEDGEPTRAVGIHIDISDQKEREQQLRQFRRAVERTAHMVYITDRDGTIEYVNPAFEEITGFSKSEAVGQTPRIIKSGEYRDNYYDELWETILSGGQWKDEMIEMRADGREIVLNQTISPLMNDAEQPKKFVAVADDITQKKEYEQQLEEQRDNLKLLNEVLRHDIRNDMNVVYGHTDLLEEHVDESGQAHLDTVQKSAESVVKLTKTARDLTKTMLSTEADIEPVRLDQHLNPVVENAREELDDAVITTEDQIPNSMVPGNELLKAVFRNLVQNAVVHNDNDIPQVQISVTVADETLTVAVADNGPGVPDNQKEQIFGKGEKGLDSPGTGIGLYLVRTLVDLYGGDVWVEDNDPRGAVFVVELPTINSPNSDTNE
ncbi:PAS domain S-box protein (plasmid) [Halorubrum sp. BOL3-1]|uniref:PAS domain S-box protein n=1 Tax=Halorubrum sp. BOL3-1 TaxID=2497325 RepID=UPI001004FBCB|nr:PAS domain S-box protein [Halorubrum sp. BOL3-1]QAU14527.1 PAS domain S-box protein [Halorubrum sp. BOL3-1]